MFRTTIKNTVKFPKILFTEDLKFVADKIFIPALQRYIDQQVGVDEKPLPPLEPATIARKRGKIIRSTFTKKGNIRASAIRKIGATGLQGFSAKTLIDTGKLIRSFFSKAISKSTVVITLNNERKDIGEYLQIDGVGKKKKKFNFFGVSSRMERDAVNYMKARIREITKT